MMLRFALPVLLLATPAAADDWYVKATVGQTSDGEVFTESLSQEGVYGAAVGYTGTSPFRFEAGVSRVEMEIGRAEEIALTGLSATVYYDLAVTDRASLFVGVGGDYFDGEFSFPVPGTSESVSFSAVGYRWGVGAAYALTPSLTADVEFRRFGGEVSDDLEADDDLNGLSFDEIRAGLRLRF